MIRRPAGASTPSAGWLLVPIILFSGCEAPRPRPPPPGILGQYEKYKVLSRLKRIIRSSPEPAVAELQLAAELAPNDSEVLDLRAQYLFRQGHDDEAERLLLSATELDPGYSGAWFSLAELYRRAGRMDEARGACSVAKQLNPLRPEYRELLLQLDRNFMDGSRSPESPNLGSGRDFTTERQKATILRRLTKGFAAR